MHKSNELQLAAAQFFRDLQSVLIMDEIKKKKKLKEGYMRMGGYHLHVWIDSTRKMKCRTK